MLFPYRGLFISLLLFYVGMPLSSFGKIGDKYVVFGALSNDFTGDQLAKELEDLGSNTLLALERIHKYTSFK